MRLLPVILLCASAMLAQKTDGVVSGTVRSAATRMPLEGVSVSLNGESASVQTDARGAFRFEGVADGAHTLHVELKGYSGPAPLKVDAGAEPVTVAMYPLAQIEGRVLQEDGTPAEGVTVDLTPRLGDATSDKTGRFLLTGLYPADYVVRLTVPQSLRAEGFPAVEFYPGVTDASQAAPVHVAEGAQMAGFDIKLRRVPLVHFKGRVIDLAKEGVVEVALDCEPGPINDSYARHDVDAEGRFHFDNVPPGRHVLQVYRGKGHDDLPYSATVDVGKDEVEVPVPKWVDVEGIVRSKTRWEGVLGIGLTGDRSWRRNVLPDEDGKFTLTAVPPGTWTLRLESNKLTLRIAGAHFGAASVLDKPLHVTESGNPPLEILLSDQSGSIAGTVQEEDPAGAKLLIYAQRLDAGPLVPGVFVEAKTDGSFLLADLLPGDYDVTAWVITESRQGVRGSDCTNRVVKVSVANGQIAAIQLKRCNQ